MLTGLSRRAFLYTVPAVAFTAEDTLAVIPSEKRGFHDPATEFDLTRLTDPEKSNCWLPRPPLKALSRGDSFLLYCSDRSGSPQAWRMDLRSGESRQLTTAAAMIPSTLTFGPADRSVLYFDRSSLISLQPRPKTLYTIEPGWSFGGQFAISANGSRAAVAEERNGMVRLRVVDLGRGGADTLLESPEPIRFLRFRPRRDGLLYGHSGNMALIGFDGRGNRNLQIAAGSVIDAQWSADGHVAHYLSVPSDSAKATQLREYLPDSAEDKLIGPTTQFASFARNGDSSVFAGISGSKGSPYILLLLRSARRELTVAEHKASRVSRSAVIFAGNSQRLYYETDRQGRSAIYTIALERFVEKTDISAATAPIRLRQPVLGQQPGWTVG
jgi:oligogalacturonide lyase